ncbi:MAG TPA: GNAT family N-acetyltransferase [Sphingobium sp.]|uniref:GNAT family N-acetyltransferase n=1 Tax=Sphingobium sp. TaxID=1912891 RepID=UPI002ED1193A
MATGLKKAVQVRAMLADDLSAAHGLSREQQWPHREQDWTRMLELGQGVVAESEGAIVGTTMWWTFENGFATIGMVIVSNAVQGMGIGRQLMEAAFADIGDRTVLLNATDEGLRLYRSLGFEPIGSVYQHQGAAFSVPIAELIPNERVAPMKVGEVPDITRLDQDATGIDRTRVVDYLCDHAQGVVLNRDGDQAGYALFRRFGRGYAIGPTIAPDIGGAKALITHWLGSNAGMFCRLDVPDDSGLSSWLDELGLPCVGRVTRMCRGTPPQRGATVRAYSLINQALG